jgi:Na+(H+)/acetate symporter ActP
LLGAGTVHHIISDRLHRKKQRAFSPITADRVVFVVVYESAEVHGAGVMTKMQTATSPSYSMLLAAPSTICIQRRFLDLRKIKASPSLRDPRK